MTLPSVVNSNTADAGTAPTQADVALTVSANSGRVLNGLPTIVDALSTITVTSVTFDPGGADEAAFTNEAPATSNFDSGVTHHTEVWWLALSDGVSTGSYTVRAVFSETSNRATMTAWEVLDADTTDPIGASGTGSGTTDTMTVDVTSTAANSLIGMVGIMREEVTFTPGADDTEETEINNNQSSTWSGHTPAATTGTYTVSCVSSDSPTTDTWCASGFEIKEAAGVTGEKFIPALLQQLMSHGQLGGGVLANFFSVLSRAIKNHTDILPNLNLYKVQC